MREFFILMVVLCFAFHVERDPFDLINDDEIQQLLIEFSDSSKVKETLGIPDDVEVHARHIGTVVNCISSYGYTMTYKMNGVVVTNSRTRTRELSSEGFGYDMQDPSEVSRTRIAIDTNSTWRVKGVQCDRNRFGDLSGMEGHWALFGDETGTHLHRFGFVSKYVIYHTPRIHDEMIDSLGLDHHDRKTMDDHFKLEKIEMMTLGNNEGLLGLFDR